MNATFTGLHDFDHLLPDWSPSGLDALRREMRTLRAGLDVAAQGRQGDSAAEGAGAHVVVPHQAFSARESALDHELARSYLDTQLAELDTAHGPAGNPSLWTGEAVFGIISLMIRDFAPVDARRESATGRLHAVADFFDAARTTLGDRPLPEAWTARALRDCQGAATLLAVGAPLWMEMERGSAAMSSALAAAAARATVAFSAFATWLRDRQPATADSLACGSALFDILLARGHHCTTSRADLLREARTELEVARATLTERANEAGGSWHDVSETLAANHPSEGDYLPAFGRTWRACRDRAAELDLVEWPDWPLQYEPYPPWTAAAAPLLYYLHYRSPAPHDAYSTYRYVVPAVPAVGTTAHLRAWNHAVIKLNHVVHHGGLGHHVQNWHAYHRATSAIARIGAVDCANRIGMFGAGTMAEGWACYATDLMDEAGFLTPAERAAEQHSRVRQLARGIVDISLHTEGMPPADAAQFYRDAAGMSDAAAQNEVARNSMFPCTALMYWLGTREIHAWRNDERRVRGATFSLRTFHDALLGCGSIPVSLARRHAGTIT